MRKNTRLGSMLLAIILLPIIGYGVAHALTLIIPLSEQGTVYRAVFTLFVILLLLAVPYGILKLTAHAAHTVNPDEKELRLADIPKDKDQLERS